ncbi:MAG: proton-conducting transporter membrane subunit, partial [Phycisphaeraceae bacterium]
YVWLPDAMEGHTPVSALIHAATMVTAGVYLIARTLPLFELSPWALPVVALVGGLTAIFAATIALCQYDIKRIWAYSTVSQLGYMFLGLGALSSVGAVFHLYTHAFFKALLFLTAGSVMHAMAGQLDLRKMSGLRHKMPVTCTLMGIGALALAGFPVITAGFFSKDMILAYTLERGLDHGVGPAGPTWYIILAVLGLVTAFLTAFYTFRLWFRVFWGPEQYEMGEEHHGVDELAPGHPHDAEQQAADQPHHAPAHAAAEHGAHGGGHDHHDAPHEMPWWPMNLPLAVLAVGAIAAGWVMFLPSDHSYGWIGAMVDGSTAHVAHEAGEHAAPTLLGMDLHLAMQLISGVIAIAGIALAAYFHLVNRDAATRVADAARPVVRVLEGKYYIDELYDAVLVRPLRLLGQVFFLIDQLLINGLVYSVAWTPRLLGYSIRPLQHGKLQGYGLGMAGGVAVVALIVWVMIAP